MALAKSSRRKEDAHGGERALVADADEGAGDGAAERVGEGFDVVDGADGFCQISWHGDEPGQALPLAARVMPPASPPSVTASV